MSTGKCNFHKWEVVASSTVLGEPGREQVGCRVCAATKTRPVKKPSPSPRSSLGSSKGPGRGKRKREFADYPEGMEGGCLFTGPGCGGSITRHHLVPQQRIRAAHATLVSNYRKQGGDAPWGLGRCLGDPRNLVLLCWDHHQRVENRVLDIGPEAIPAGFYEFVAEFGLERARVTSTRERRRDG